MRVVAGSAGGRRLRAPAGRKVRPTTDMVREAVFSSLASLNAVEGKRVVDLFAGTGALGIEALSRGASSAVFVEADPTAIAVIRANLADTGLARGATVVRSDAIRWVRDAAASGGRFDLVFADPPYAFADWPAVLDDLPTRLVALESRSHLDLGPRWGVIKSKRHGDTVVTIARRSSGPGAGNDEGATV